MTIADVKRTWCLKSVLNFSAYMFREKNGAPFVMGHHHAEICKALDKVVSGQTKRLIINIAPRYSKTELVSKLFIAYGFALNPRSRFLHLSYSDDLVKSNSSEVNELMRSPYYTSLFPEVSVVGTSATHWNTTAGGSMYAVSSGGQVTGFGAGQVENPEEQREIDNCLLTASATTFSGAIVIDDPLKADDALSDSKREAVNYRFDNVIRSRVNSRNTPIIIIMQRLHEHDLCGHLLGVEPDEWEVLSFPCLTIDEKGSEVALWPFKHTAEELHKMRAASPYVFETQYQQNPKPLEGLLYPRPFRTYAALPTASHTAKSYTDTADTGSDYLCSICYEEYTEGLFVTDVLYTKKPMEYTEVEVARMLSAQRTKIAYIESNNGGRGFARNVERNCRELGNNSTAFHSFTQSANKQARIFTRSAEVQNLVFFPEGWERRWPEFYNALTSYRKEGRNAHDDAPDALTGCVEKKQRTTKMMFI